MLHRRQAMRHDQNRFEALQRASDADALALTTRNANAALTDDFSDTKGNI